MPLSSVGREKLEHLCVVGGAACECQADDGGQVVVANAEGVWIAAGALPDLGGGPDSDARQRLQSAVGLLRRQRDNLLKPAGDSGCGGDCSGAD